MSMNRDQYLSEIWKQVLEYLNANTNLGHEVIDSFFRPCTIWELTNQKAVIIAGDVISKQLVMPEVNNISAALSEILDSSFPIRTEVLLKSELDQAFSAPVGKNSFVVDEDFSSMPIQKDRTFDKFVVGDCNKECHAASLACAARPGQFYSPLFIYGNSGLGKTHLLMAIANYVMDHDPTKNVYYTESLKFVETVVNAIRDNKIDQFKRYMYSVDVLLIDDIQFLAGKEKSHEVFFTIYNELINNRKQVVIASDRQPNEIKGLEDRLISRFSGGLSLGIDSPEFETSLAILKMKIRQVGYEIEDIDEEGLSYIASNFSGNVRNLEGALNRVLFYAIQFQKDTGCIRFETVMNALKSQAVVSDRTGLSPKKIIKAVADYYGLTRQQITSKTRTKNIANARHISIYLCRNLLDLPYIKIGEEFGGRDHSTIISACDKVEKQLQKDQALVMAINDIKKQIGA